MGRLKGVGAVDGVKDHQHTEAASVLQKFISKKDPSLIIRRTVSKKSPMCPCCKFDGGSIESSVSHIDHLLNKGSDPPLFPIKEMLPQSRGDVRCTICRSTPSNESRLRIHLKIHMREAHMQIRKCEKCNEEFENTVAYFMHLKTHKKRKNNSGHPERECPVCKKWYAPLSYANHVTMCKRKADNNYIMCDQCDFKTTVKANLTGHYARRHGAERPFTCIHCAKPFLRECDMNQHIRRRHPAPGQEVICEDCGKTMRDQYALAGHKRSTHNSKFIYRCKVCNQSFSDKGKMYRHLLIHSDLELYQCTLCSKRFKNGPAGQCHRKNEHDGRGQCQLQKSDIYEEMKRTLVLQIEKTDQLQLERPFKRFRGSVTANVPKVEEADYSI